MASNLKETLAERVRARRVELEWTQTELARQASMRQSTVSEIESAEHAATLETVERLAKALKCRAADLLS